MLPGDEINKSNDREVSICSQLYLVEITTLNLYDYK